MEIVRSIVIILEHRNLTLEDGIHIIITNFISYKERLHNEELHSYNETNHSISYRESISSPKYLHQSSKLSQADTNPPILTFENKLPLPMLLCLLADGRQLTLDEIDRILIYLIEKKAKMLTLPPGTLPPLPAQYATMNTFSHQTGTLIFLYFCIFLMTNCQKNEILLYRIICSLFSIDILSVSILIHIQLVFDYDQQWIRGQVCMLTMKRVRAEIVN